MNIIDVDGNITYDGKQLLIQCHKYTRKHMRFFPQHNLHMLKDMYKCDVTDIMVPNLKTADKHFNAFIDILQAIKNTVTKHSKFKLYKSPRVKLNRMLEALPKIIQDDKTTVIDTETTDDFDIYRIEVTPKICTVENRDIFIFHISKLYEYQFVNPYDDLFDDLYDDDTDNIGYDDQCLMRIDIDPVEANQ